MSETTQSLEAKDRKADFDSRLDNRLYLAEQLEALLAQPNTTKEDLISGLVALGMIKDGEGGNKEIFEQTDIEDVRNRMQIIVEEFRNSSPVAPSLRNTKETAVIKGATREAVSRVGVELSTERRTTLLTLKANYSRHENSLKTGITENELDTYFTQNPEKLDQISKLMERKGELTIIGRARKNKDCVFRFAEISNESPEMHRDIDHPTAEKIAREQYGAELVETEEYEDFSKKLKQGEGTTLDFNTWSWLAKGNKQCPAGSAFYGRDGGARGSYAGSRDRDRGLRCALEV